MNTLTDTRIRKATQKQFDFIKSLIADRELDDELTAWVAGARQEAIEGNLYAEQASSLIDALLAAPKKAAPATDEPQAGVYTDGTNFVRVYLGQNSGIMLAKTINTHSDGPMAEDQYVDYTYIGAARRALTPNFRRMTVEEVGSLGVTFNHCLMCGRRLDDPVSVDRGIGPVCAANY